jgi:hypothetical protein
LQCDNAAWPQPLRRRRHEMRDSFAIAT